MAFLKEIYLDYSPLSGLHIVLGERDSYLLVKKKTKNFLCIYSFFLGATDFTLNLFCILLDHLICQMGSMSPLLFDSALR